MSQKRSHPVKLRLGSSNFWEGDLAVFLDHLFFLKLEAVIVSWVVNWFIAKGIYVRQAKLCYITDACLSLDCSYLFLPRVQKRKSIYKLKRKFARLLGLHSLLFLKQQSEPLVVNRTHLRFFIFETFLDLKNANTFFKSKLFRFGKRWDRLKIYRYFQMMLELCVQDTQLGLGFKYHANRLRALAINQRVTYIRMKTRRRTFRTQLTALRRNFKKRFYWINYLKSNLRMVFYLKWLLYLKFSYYCSFNGKNMYFSYFSPPQIYLARQKKWNVSRRRRGKHGTRGNMRRVSLLNGCAGGLYKCATKFWRKQYSYYSLVMVVILGGTFKVCSLLAQWPYITLLRQFKRQFARAPHQIMNLFLKGCRNFYQKFALLAGFRLELKGKGTTQMRAKRKIYVVGKDVAQGNWLQTVFYQAVNLSAYTGTLGMRCWLV